MAGKPDINRASREELAQVPDIGDEMAEHIIRNRPYRSPEDLRKIPGVGPERAEFLREHLTISGGESGR